jgi:tripartite-type tricarboxylate transporter receptor subunit TctC
MDIGNVARAAVTFAAMLGCTGHAAAQSEAGFPSRVITLVVPFAAGGVTDGIARVIADGLGKELGKSVIVENRPGGSTAIGARTVARAAPDGYTLMAVDISFVVAPQLASNYGVDPLKDFKAVGLSARSVLVFITPSQMPARTLQEFVKLAKSKPDEIKMAHSGVGTTPHLALMSFTQSIGINPLLIPYRTSMDSILGIIRGDVSGVFA